MRLRPLERDFQAAVVRLARLCGWRVYCVHDSRHSPAGWPDLVLLRGRRILYRELKRDGRASRLTPEQRDTLAALEHAGQDAAVWTPDDWPDIERTLARPPRGSRA